MNRYTVLTTCKATGSANVGDLLIEESLKALVLRERPDAEFLTFFREDHLEEHLEAINASRAVLMPAFPVRDTPMHPVTYRLVDDLGRIRVPLVPIGANYNTYPGDADSRASIAYSPETAGFLHHVAAQVPALSCREYHTCEVLRRHAIANTVMTGDPAWYDLESLGSPMKRPERIERVVFTPPLSPFFAEQAETMMAGLAREFPHASRYCCMHLRDSGSGPGHAGGAERSAAMSPEVAEKNDRIRAFATENGFETREAAGDTGLLAFYATCDLHVGYECHAHVAFLRSRSPSVLIHEDARGVGFSYTLGVGGFDGFVRTRSGASTAPRKTITSGYCTSAEELNIAAPRTDMHEDVLRFLREEIESRFARYLGLANLLDETYERKMRPFLQAVLCSRSL